MSGAISYYAGLAAEDQVAAEYARRGHKTCERRWRGRGGEIDLIVEDGDGLVFVEVKRARDFARAAERVSRRQMQRIYDTAGEYLARMPMGLNTNARFDVALVDGTGRIEILENAFGH
ncbi:MAG: YraN family protein [Paracoccaceae bacterium]